MSIESKLSSVLNPSKSKEVNIVSLEQIGKNVLGSIWKSMPAGLQSSIDKEAFVSGATISVVSNGGDSYSVDITLPDDLLKRSSLFGDVGVYNIIGLFSKGYTIPDEKKLPSGMWHGNKTLARRKRAASKFVSDAVDAYVGVVGDGYKITECTVSDLYS